MVGKRATQNCPFTYAVIFLLPKFPVDQFSAAHFSGCRVFRGLFRFRYFRHFMLPFFLPSQFSSPNFLVAQFSVAHFPVAVFFCRPFSVDVISHINFVLPCFSTLSFFVADFSNCPISGCRFFRCRFYLLPASHLSV